MMASLLALMSLLLCLTAVSMIRYTVTIVPKKNTDTIPDTIKNILFGLCLGFVLISCITLVLVNEYIKTKESQEIIAN